MNNDKNFFRVVQIHVFFSYFCDDRAICVYFAGCRAEAKTDSLGVTMTNVYDAFGKDDKDLTQDFGFSCVVNYKGKMILFDSGTDARIFEKNLKALKIRFKED